MNWLYDSVEPRVMDEDMLKLAVGEQGPRDEAGQLVRQEGILFKDVLSLRLDFQSAYPGLGWGHQAAQRPAPGFSAPELHAESRITGPTSAGGPAWVRRHRNVRECLKS